MSGQPLFVLFAGVNGAEKSTLFRYGLWDKTALELNIPRVNSDEILRANGGDWASIKQHVSPQASRALVEW